MTKPRTNSKTFALLFLMCLAWCKIAHAQQGVVAIDQAVDKAMDTAGNDPVSIEAAIRNVMNEVNPTTTGMGKIASAAMRKVAGYNDRKTMSAVSSGTAKAALGQALSKGLNPIRAAASVSEGLVGAATTASARKGANSPGSAKSISENTIDAIVQTAGGLGMPLPGVANASAFGAMNASLNASVEYGVNTASIAKEVTIGLTAGAIMASRRLNTDAELITRAVIHGVTDSVYSIADTNSMDPTPLLNAAQQGFNHAHAAHSLTGRAEESDEEMANNDLLGSTRI